MNVNQSEDVWGPNAAVLLGSTQAKQHLTENFLIAPWSRSINALALAIICPVSFLLRARLLCATAASQANHSHCCGWSGERECSWFIIQCLLKYIRLWLCFSQSNCIQSLVIHRVLLGKQQQNVLISLQPPSLWETRWNDNVKSEKKTLQNDNRLRFHFPACDVITFYFGGLGAAPAWL